MISDIEVVVVVVIFGDESSWSSEFVESLSKFPNSSMPDDEWYASVGDGDIVNASFAADRGTVGESKYEVAGVVH